MKDTVISIQIIKNQQRKKISFRHTIIIVITIILSVGSCSVYTPEKRDLEPELMPKQYRLFTDKGIDTPDKWWKSFQSSELNKLIERGLENNFDILQARARIKQAKASLEKVGGSVVPSISVNTGATHSIVPDTDGTNAYSLGLSASYELDLWGRVDALVEAERLDYKATQADLETSAMSIAASITETWLSIISTRQAIQILNGQVKNNLTMLTLLEFRFENGMTTVLDVLQQQEALASSRAAVPPLEAQEQELLNTLALLLGYSSSDAVNVRQQTLPQIPYLPSTGIPADLLAKRPDIRSAGLNLKSSDWDIAAVRANRLPAVNLTGSHLYSSANFSTLLDNWVFSLGASLAATLYDGGVKSAEVKRVEAVVEEELASYKQTVFNAVFDVENSIMNEKKQAEYITLLNQQLSLARKVLKEAERQYTNGLQTFLPVITEIPKVQILEKQIVTEKATLLKYRIALFRSIGGSWAQELIPPEKKL